MTLDTDTTDGTGESTTAAHPIAEHRADQRHEAATLPVIEPSVPRAEVGATDERVGAVAYPYRVAEARVRIERPLLAAREDEYVVSVDCCRRLAIRGDVVPSTTDRAIPDVLVLPAELSTDAADEKARDAAFRWTLRRFTLWNTPTVDLRRTVDAYKLFWLVETPAGTVLVDSVRGDRRRLAD